MEREREVNQYLEEQGWTVLRFWGNDIKNDVSACADRIESLLFYRSNREAD